jgi:hypothetical protein
MAFSSISVDEISSTIQMVLQDNMVCACCSHTMLLHPITSMLILNVFSVPARVVPGAIMIEQNKHIIGTQHH